MASVVSPQFSLLSSQDSPVLAATAEVLQRDTTGLVVVLVNHRGEGITPLLAHAAQRSCVHMVWGDLEEDLAHDFSRPRSRLLSRSESTDHPRR